MHLCPPPPRRRARARIAGACAVLVLAAGCGELQPLTTEEALDKLNIATTKVYASDESLIADLHGEINRVIVPIDVIPQHVRDAVVAIEDERFWRHGGLDARSIGRAVIANIEEGDDDEGRLQGGSTLSQQLAKNLYFHDPERTIQRKLAEAKVSVQLEQRYDKPQILEMYLNTTYFGRGVYGIQTAARSYFHKDAEDLDLAEAAFLAGIIHQPARYGWTSADPAEQREERARASEGRRGVVLAKMEQLGMITSAQREEVSAVPLKVQDPPESLWRYPYFVDMVLRQLGVLRNSRSTALDERFGFLGATMEERAQQVYQRGLRIYTTLDPSAQSAAEEAISKVLPERHDRLFAALAAVEPSTGYIRALVGGKDYYPGGCEEEPDLPVCEYARVNMALGDYGGGSGRQPGSAFKVPVLAAALERGVSLNTHFSGAPFTHTYRGGTWPVRNYEGSSGGGNLIEATVNSVNAAYARVLVDGVGEGDALVGARRVADMSRRMGIPFPTREQVMARCGDRYGRTDRCIAADDVPAIALGAKEVSPLDMAVAYATIANDGVHLPPTAIVRITDADGNVLYDAADHTERPQRAMAVGVARAISYVLQQVVTRGTGIRARLGRPAAGKTGTSQQWRDASFVGYTPDLAAAVWVGNPTPEEMTPANGYPFRVVGGSFPAMIWQYFMTKALEGIPASRFPAPPPELFAAVAPTPGPETPVPDVIGLDRDGAADVLTAAGFSVLVSDCLAPGHPEGVVVKQTPGPNSVAPRGSPVTICLSVAELPFQVSPSPPPGAQPSYVTVPHVVGESTAKASSTLRHAGFDVDTERTCDPSEQTGAGKVWRQSPPGGTLAQHGSTVNIWTNPAGC